MKGLTRAENRRAWLWAAAIVAALLALGAGAWLLFGQNRPASARVDRSVERPRGLDRIEARLTFDPAADAALTGTETLTLTNRTGQTQDAAVLRSWTGAWGSASTTPAGGEDIFDLAYGGVFSAGGLECLGARADGAETAFAWLDEARTVLSVTVPGGWADGQTVTLSLDVAVTVPRCAGRFGHSGGVWMLGDVLPQPALWQDGAWRTDPWPLAGEPFIRACADWRVTLTAPEGYALAATGGDSAAGADGQTVHTFTADAARSFGIALAEGWTVRTRTADGIPLRAMAPTDERADALLDAAQAVLPSYERRWGPWLGGVCTLAEADMPFTGAAWSGLTVLPSRTADAGGQTLELAAARLLARQWWGEQVGSDCFYAPWQDESLSEWAMLSWVGDRWGEESRQNAAFERVETAMRITLSATLTPGSPADYFADWATFRAIAGQRGCALWIAMENLMGRETFDGALRAFAEEHRWGVASREDLERTLTEAAGMDVGPMFVDYLDTVLQ